MKSTFLQIALIVSGGFVAAQTAIVPLSAVCPAGQITVATQTSTLHSPAGDSAIVKLSCIKLDASVTLDAKTTPPTIKAVFAPTTTPQKMYVETFTIDPATPAASATATYALQNKPAAGTVLLIFFKASQLGSDVSTGVAADSSSQQIVVTLPTYRPFNGDTVTIVYWA